MSRNSLTLSGLTGIRGRGSGASLFYREPDGFLTLFPYLIEEDGLS